MLLKIIEKLKKGKVQRIHNLKNDLMCAGTGKCESISQKQWLIPVILATWEAKIGRIMDPGQLRSKKFVRSPISTEKCWVWKYTPTIPATVGILNWRITIQASLSKNETPMSKITEQKGLELWLKQ
jgi:hypothetical protein